MDARKTGALIAQLRKERGFTQKELAERLHVSDKAISRWETGKGFPDTTLLKPLSDVLGIGVSELLAGELIPRENRPEQADAVIVQTLQHSQKERQRGLFWFFLLLAIMLVFGTVGILELALKPTPVDMLINQSKTSIRYDLGTKYEGSGLFFDDPVYHDLIKCLQPFGFEYTRPDGSERYAFTQDEKGDYVLSYIHCSGEGMLFGFRIGDATIIKGNDALDVSGYSLTEYLMEQGFRWKHDEQQYGRPTLVYVNGERCNWIPYVKDGVYINLCLSAYEGRKLVAFDIGLCDQRNTQLWEELERGYGLTVEDPFGFLTADPSGYYPQWEPVTLTAAVPEGTYKTLYCYINSKLVGKFERIGDKYQFTISMPNIHSSVLVTPEEQK